MGAGKGRSTAEPLEVVPSGRLLGLTLRQAVVLAVISYTLVIGLFIVKNFDSEDSTSGDNPKLVTGSSRQKSLALFNAEGELESVVGEEDVDDRILDNVYHSAVVFELNYADMLSKFKIFLYTVDDHSFKALSDGVNVEELNSTDEFFVYQLYHSDFVTPDPEQAHLFLLPVSVVSVEEDSSIFGPKKSGKFLSKYVQTLRDDYPYWTRTLGADHVIVICTNLEGDGTRNFLELNKNAIQVACSPLAGGQTFYPHKDVAVPLKLDIPQTLKDAGGARSRLIYYKGEVAAAALSSVLGVEWETDDRFASEPSEVDPTVHQQRLSTSNFCLILGPADYPNIVTALRFGCVPVLVSDGKLYDLPFQDILNWNQFCVILSEANVKNMVKTLSSYDESQHVTMQYLGKEASKRLEWHDPPQERDAFYMVLYDLWIRRHAVRYVRREEL